MKPERDLWKQQRVHKDELVKIDPNYYMTSCEHHKCQNLANIFF